MRSGQRDSDRSRATQLRNQPVRASGADAEFHQEVGGLREAWQDRLHFVDGSLFTPPGFAVYVATKHALEAVAEAMMQELAPFGIKVQTINPGAYLTGFNETMADKDMIRPSAPKYAIDK